MELSEELGEVYAEPHAVAEVVVFVFACCLEQGVTEHYARTHAIVAESLGTPYILQMS